MSSEEAAEDYPGKETVNLEGTYEVHPSSHESHLLLNLAKQTVTSIAYIPFHSLIVAASLDTCIRVYCEDSRDPYFVFTHHFSPVRGVVHLYDKFVASIDDYGNIITWDVIYGKKVEVYNVFGNPVRNVLANRPQKNSKQMEECKVGVYSFVKMSNNVLLVGTKQNKPIYIAHVEGRLMNKSIEGGKGYQASYMTDIAVYGPKMVTASSDNSVVIRDSQRRIALCKSQFDSGVISTAINARYIAAGCNNGYLYILRNTKNFELECTFKETNDKLLTLNFIDSEILMVGGTSGYLSFLSIKGRCYLSRIRMHLDKYIYSAVLLPGGRVAVGGGKGNSLPFALVASIPSEVSSILSDQSLSRASPPSSEVSLELRKIRDFIDRFSTKTIDQLRQLTLNKSNIRLEQAEEERERAEKLVERASSDSTCEDLVKNLREAVEPLARSHVEARSICEEIDEFVAKTEGRLKCLRSSVDALERLLDDPVCVFCLETMLPGDIVIRLNCLHLFHRDCLVPYLRQQYRPCCPIDRKAVNIAELDSMPVWKYGEEEERTQSIPINPAQSSVPSQSQVPSVPPPRRFAARPRLRFGVGLNPM